MGSYGGRYVVDTHCHVQDYTIKMPEKEGDKPKLWWWDNSYRALYDMDRYGIDLCIIMSGGLGKGMDVDVDLEIAKKNPGRFAVLCYPTTLVNNVHKGKAKFTIEAAVAETEERLKTGLYKGLGQGFAISMNAAAGESFPRSDDSGEIEVLSAQEKMDRYRLYMDLAVKYDIPVTEAPVAMGIDLMQALAMEYPNVNIVAQLSGIEPGWHREIQDLCELVGNCQNVYLEMGCCAAELYEIALSDPKVGPGHIMHGTDWGAGAEVYYQPGRGIRGGPETCVVGCITRDGQPTYQSDIWGWSLHQIDRLRDTLNQDDINLILGGNAARVFKLELPHTKMFREVVFHDLWSAEGWIVEAADLVDGVEPGR